MTDDAAGRTFYCPCNCWFDKKEGDGLTERLLMVAQPGAAGADALCSYKVTVYTSDVKFGGTDANVFMEILGDRCAIFFGDRGALCDAPLANPLPVNFERH